MLKTIYFGTLSGIRLYVHWTFWILILYLVIRDLGSGLSHTLTSVLFVFAIFFCVFLHELGHAFSGRWFGVKTHDITLYPIGGVARMQLVETTPFAELVITACGPLVNLAIALLLFLTFPMSFSFEEASDIHGLGFVQHLFLVNIALFCFNLLPVYPMDGGRILRAILRYFVSRENAVVWTARLGQVLAGAFVLYGLFTFQILLVVIFGLMFLACSAELFQAKLRKAMHQTEERWNGVDPYETQSPHSRGDVIDAEEVRRVP